MAKQSVQSWVSGALFMVLSSLQDPAGVQMTIKKESVNELLGGKTKSSEGQLYYKQGKIRLEIKGAEDSVLVIDRKTIWYATTLPQDMGGKTMVSRSHVGALKGASTVLGVLLNEKKLDQQFRQNKQKSLSDGRVYLELSPRKPKESEIQQLEVWLTDQQKRIEKLKYRDDKENIVTYVLGRPQKLLGNQDKKFQFVPPKNSEITEF